MKKSLVIMFLAAVTLVAVSVPAVAAGDPSFASLELKYWMPKLSGEAETPVAIIFHGHDEEHDACHDIWQWVPLDPTASGSFIASGKIKLGDGAMLGINYWSVRASDSFGSWQEPFDFEAYAPGMFEDEYLGALFIWNEDYWKEDYWNGDDWLDRMVGSKKTAAWALDAKYIKSLNICEDGTADLSIGIRKANLNRNAELGIGWDEEYDGEFNGLSVAPMQDGEDPLYLHRERTESTQDFSFLGPQVGIHTRKNLWGPVSLFGGVDLALLYGTLNETGLYVGNEYVWVDSKSGEEELEDMDDLELFDRSIKVTVPTLDVEIGLSYSIRHNIEVTAGYYNSTWLGVPGPMAWDEDEWLWRPAQDRSLSYSGLTIGAKVSF